MADKHDRKFLQGFRPLPTLLRPSFRSLEPLNRGLNLKKRMNFTSIICSHPFLRRRNVENITFHDTDFFAVNPTENVDTQINYFP